MLEQNLTKFKFIYCILGNFFEILSSKSSLFYKLTVYNRDLVYHDLVDRNIVDYDLLYFASQNRTPPAVKHITAGGCHGLYELYLCLEYCSYEVVDVSVDTVVTVVAAVYVVINVRNTVLFEVVVVVLRVVVNNCIIAACCDEYE